jgi:hypothetical protein
MLQTGEMSFTMARACTFATICMNASHIHNKAIHQFFFGNAFGKNLFSTLVGRQPCCQIKTMMHNKITAHLFCRSRPMDGLPSLQKKKKQFFSGIGSRGSGNSKNKGPNVGLSVMASTKRTQNWRKWICPRNPINNKFQGPPHLDQL